jgi:hypothetical protein
MCRKRHGSGGRYSSVYGNPVSLASSGHSNEAKLWSASQRLSDGEASPLPRHALAAPGSGRPEKFPPNHRFSADANNFLSESGTAQHYVRAIVFQPRYSSFAGSITSSTHSSASE